MLYIQYNTKYVMVLESILYYQRWYLIDFNRC